MPAKSVNINVTRNTGVHPVSMGGMGCSLHTGSAQQPRTPRVKTCMHVDMDTHTREGTHTHAHTYTLTVVCVCEREREMATATEELGRKRDCGRDKRVKMRAEGWGVCVSGREGWTRTHTHTHNTQRRMALAATGNTCTHSVFSQCVCVCANIHTL